MGKFKINPLLPDELDRVADVSGYLPLSGGTLTGDVIFPATGFIMQIGGQYFRVTLDEFGALDTNPEEGAPATFSAGEATGLLGLTYSGDV